MEEAYRAELTSRIRAVLAKNPDLADHLRAHPWLTGSLGDPRSGIWFVGENPSLSMVQRATAPGGGPPCEDSQWYASRGDTLFRQMLYKHGFKESPPDAIGGGVATSPMRSSSLISRSSGGKRHSQNGTKPQKFGALYSIGSWLKAVQTSSSPSEIPCNES
jgi:hypothetical protein